MLTRTVDLNCDMGEGMDTDADIFPFISSVNIACGSHAGDADTMRRTVEWALRHHAAIGAHPSYPDKENFGRVDMLGQGLTAEEIPVIVVNQLITLQAICDEFGALLHHVKPHGALYNRAARDASVAALICRAIREFDPALQLYGLSGSVMQQEAAKQGLVFVSEVFADRSYQPDGSLTPRNLPGALIPDTRASVDQVLQMVGSGKVMAENAEIPILADTICLHGDGDHAVEFAAAIYEALTLQGIAIEAPRSVTPEPHRH